MINVFWFVNDGHCCTQFNKDSGKTVEEYKLRVVYLSPQAARGNSEDEALTGVQGNFDNDSVSSAIFLFFKFGCFTYFGRLPCTLFSPFPVTEIVICIPI